MELKRLVLFCAAAAGTVGAQQEGRPRADWGARFQSIGFEINPLSKFSKVSVTDAAQGRNRYVALM